MLVQGLGAQPGVVEACSIILIRALLNSAKYWTLCYTEYGKVTECFPIFNYYANYWREQGPKYGIFFCMWKNAHSSCFLLCSITFLVTRLLGCLCSKIEGRQSCSPPCRQSVCVYWERQPCTHEHFKGRAGQGWEAVSYVLSEYGSDRPPCTLIQTQNPR